MWLCFQNTVLNLSRKTCSIWGIHFIHFFYYSVEPVEIVYPDNTTKVYPQLEPRQANAKVDYINSCTGLELPGDEICKLLNKMSLDASIDPKDNNQVLVNVPPTRWDILHACDIMEDVAISYGYDNLPKKMPNVNTFGAPLPLNKLSDHIRKELAMAGFTEVAPLILVSVFFNDKEKLTEG